MRALLPVTLLLALVGCRQDMHDGPKIEPLESHPFFDDGQGARQLPAGTVPRGFLREDAHLYEGKDASGAFAAALPMALDRALLERGQQRYGIFCAPCHDMTGNGRGMIVRRGYKQPESYHTDRLRAMPVGYYFDVITNGFGVMPTYAVQVPVEDRWAIAAYIRALQLSQGARLAELPSAVTSEMQQAMSADHAAGDDHGADGSGHGAGHGAGGHHDEPAARESGWEPGFGQQFDIEDEDEDSSHGEADDHE